MKKQALETEIAIVGMAGRFPGASNVAELWNNLKNGVESIVEFNDEELKQAGISEELLANKNYIKAKGYLENASMFDANFFNSSSHEAMLLDPQFRLLLEVAWEAMENAGHVPGDATESVGVFVGSSASNYHRNIVGSSSQAQEIAQLSYHEKDFLATFLAYKLNLSGPCINVQTACSTSLVAICMACDNLLVNNCDLALAGGVSVTVPLKEGYLFQENMILSPEGHCRAFDVAANGTVPGNGLGVLVLKRLASALADHDHIHAIIKGYAVNNDGNSKVSFAAPSVQGQTKVLEKALVKAGIEPQQVSYIEAHGTGTKLGDPIETKALSRVFCKNDKPIVLGALKPNIGHLDIAAGVAGVIKTVEMLKHQMFPPTINFSSLNPAINFGTTSFRINTKLESWSQCDYPRYAGLSSFGIGGTNAHVILQESIGHQNCRLPDEPVLLVLSANRRSAVVRRRRYLAEYIHGNPETSLRDIAFTLQVGRRHMEDRFACICSTREQAIEFLNDVDEMVFLDAAYAELNTIAQEWLVGAEVDWLRLYSSSLPYRVPLPTYFFEGREYWNAASPMKQEHEKSGAIEAIVSEIFKSFLGADNISASDQFYDLGGDSLLILQILEEIRKKLNIVVAMEDFEKYATPGELARC